MSTNGESALRHAVRARLVLRAVAELGLVLGVTVLVPVAAAVWYREPDQLAAYGAVGGLLVALGLLARRARAPRDLQQNEALVVTVAAFALAPVAMSLPLLLHGIPWPDALFEAVSGVTTTGLSTLGSVEDRSHTFLLARAWMQWVGGLGFVVLSVALVLAPGELPRRLGAADVDPGDVVGSVREHARRVLAVYATLTVLGIALLIALGATGFDAVVHTLAGVSTGGFAPRDASLAPLSLRLQCGVLALSTLGAVSLPLYLLIPRGRLRRVAGDVQLRALLAFVLLTVALLFVASRLAAPAGGGVPAQHLVLLALSAQTTTGFSTVAIGDLPAMAKAVVVFSMITGGSVGSTAGGVKLLRVLLVARLVQWLIVLTRLPSRAVTAPTLAGRHLELPELARAIGVILLFLGVLSVSWLAFLAHGYDPLDALFEVASATGTVGLSTGIARPELEPFLKGVLCTDMLLGRLEVFAVLVALSPRTWIGRRAS